VRLTFTQATGGSNGVFGTDEEDWSDGSPYGFRLRGVVYADG
jgi:hypothetical protein